MKKRAGEEDRPDGFVKVIAIEREVDVSLKVVQIAGSQVNIDPGSRVRLSNPADTTVFADSHHYDNGMNGNFTGTGNCHPAHSDRQSIGRRPGC